MTSRDDLQFPLDANFSLFLDPSDTSNSLTACPENPSLLASENEHRGIVGSISVSGATNDVYPSTLIENLRTNQETVTTTNSSFVQEIVPQHQSFHHQDHYSRSFNAVENFPGMPPCSFRSGQRESVFRENCLLTSTNKITQMGSNVQQVGRTNGPTNLNPMFQNHRIHTSLFQAERYDEDLLLEKLEHNHKNDQMHRPEPSNMPMPPYMGNMLSNQHQVPNASYSNTTLNPEYRAPMISNNHTPKTSESYSPFAHMSYQSDPYAFHFQNSSSLQTTTRRPRGRPRKNQIPMGSLVHTTPTLFTFLRHYGTQDEGKQPITTVPCSNPTLYNQYQNSYANTMTRQSGVLRQRSCFDQLENESSSSKTRRIMGTFQEKTIADSSTVSVWQNENMRSSAGYADNHREERSIQNGLYDPLYAAIGLPIDPHLRAYNV